MIAFTHELSLLSPEAFARQVLVERAGAVHVVVGEMIPKNLALAGPERSALVLVPALLFITRVLRPVICVMERLAKSLVRLFGVEPKDEIASTFTVEEVEHILAAEFKSHKLDPKDAPMYAQMLVGMIALTGQWWLNSRKFKKHEVAAHVVNLAWNGLTGLEPKPTLTTGKA